MTDRQSHGRPERRLQLLEAARVRFIAKGYANTPVSAIVRDAGVSQGTFYLYFESKQALLADLQREVFHAYSDVLKRVAHLEVRADERLARVVLAMAAEVESHLELERVFRHAGSAEATLLAARAGRARLAQVATAWLVAGVREGSLRTEDPASTAAMLVTLFDEILYEALAYEPDRVDVVIRAALRFVLQGVGVPSDRVEHLLTMSAEWRDEWRC